MFWVNTKAYIFPPCSLIAEVLVKVEHDQAQSLILIAPLWKTQPCYPGLLKLFVVATAFIVTPISLILLRAVVY